MSEKEQPVIKVELEQANENQDPVAKKIISNSSLSQKIILSGLDLEIEKGSLCIIIGEIGSGKSSLLNAMLG